MAYIIEITEDKLSNLSEYAEKMLRYGGKVMQCLDELQRDNGMYNHRSGRGGQGNYRQGYRDEFDGGDYRREMDEYNERRYGGSRYYPRY